MNTATGTRLTAMNEHGGGECWVVSDGAAGNEKQALALAHALGEQPRVFRIELRRPWRWLAPNGPRDPRKALTAASRTRLDPPWPRLAIGCGRAAALVALGLKRLSAGRTRAVQILDPRRLRGRFDALIVPRHDDLDGGNVLTTLGALNEVDDAWLARGRAAFARLAELPAPRTAVLVGGPTPASPLDPPYVDGLLALLEEWRRRDGGSFLVTCSRRTPGALVQRLRLAFGRHPGTFWAGEADGANPYAGLLAWADRIVVTPDSANLLSEACATGVPVLSHMPTPIDGKLGGLVGELIDSGRLRRLQARFQPWRYPPLRETLHVANALRARLDPVPDHRPG